MTNSITTPGNILKEIKDDHKLVQQLESDPYLSQDQLNLIPPFTACAFCCCYCLFYFFISLPLLLSEIKSMTWYLLLLRLPNKSLKYGNNSSEYFPFPFYFPPGILLVPQRAASVTTGTTYMYFDFVSAASVLLLHSKNVGCLGALLRFGAMPFNHVPLRRNSPSLV